MIAADFRERAARGIATESRTGVVHLATLAKVDQRASAMAELHDAEAIRDQAARIKRHTLERLPHYLEQFVDAVERSGGVVHFAHDAEAARRIICDIATKCDARLAVKSKSMTTEEVHLNDALIAAGVRVVETDLGEFIVQIDHDRPSHIVTPIIHKNRRQIATAMAREIGCDYTEDPAELTRIARAYLRDIFRRCDLGISGVNFGIAETGTLCLCTNEGNGRLTVTRPRVHIALMGIEKLLPRMRDLPAMLKLLARSATGQPLTTYTTLIRGPRRDGDADGPLELHVVLLDNGRSNLLAGPFVDVLRCIRCGACLNACPVYRNVGGHAYGSVYPGPIGSLITPLLRGMEGHDDLPRASSLCGACFDACPVKIDIPTLLVKLREAGQRRLPLSKRITARAIAWVFDDATRFEWAQRLLQLGLRPGPDGWIQNAQGPFAAWTRTRDLPAPAGKSFRRRWREGFIDDR